MKKFILKLTHSTLILIFSTISLSTYATGPLDPMPDVIFSGPYTEWGTNVQCHGGVGTLNISILGGSPPYTYQWHNSSGTLVSTSKNLVSFPAGVYTLSLYKSGNHSDWNFTMSEPSAINISLETSTFNGGYNISQNGGSDGWINCNVTGGVPSYYYQWSNSSNDYEITSLSAGTYSVTVTDENGCTATSSRTLTAPPVPLNIVSITSPLHHGYNISCNGENDGLIDLTISGGLPPYTYNWGSGFYTQDRDSLPAGTYTVIVDDNIPGGQDTAHITLTQPVALSLGLFPQIFPNGFNTSCYNCNDGKITTAVGGGTSPYTYLWSNGKTTTFIDSLPKGMDTVTVTDNNGCKIKQSIELTSVFEGWKIGGNNDIDTSKQFMGTKDNKDLIFKTNNIKRMTVKANGSIEMNSPLKISHATITNNDYRIVYAHADGTLDFDGGEAVNGTTDCVSRFEDAWIRIINNTGCPAINTNDIYLKSSLRNVAIGSSAVPLARLDVFGGIRSSDLSGPIGFNVVYVNGDGILKKLDFPPGLNPSLNVLHGNGTWGVLPLGSYAWNFNGTDIINSASNIKIGIGNSVPHDNVEIGNLFTLHGDNTNNWIGFNNIYNGSIDKRIADGFASRIVLGNQGDIQLLTSVTGLESDPNTINWKGLIINNEGKVSIGTTQNDKLFTVNGEVQFLNGVNGNNHNTFQILSGSNLPERRGINIPDEEGPANEAKPADFNFFIHDFNGTAAFNFCKSTPNLTTPFEKLMQIRKDGKVGIGISESSDWNGEYKLYVKNGIRTEKIKVDVAQTPGWADYVFEENYQLRSLTDLENFIKEHGHLPEIPSASEVVEQGIDLAEIDSKLLLKIEELTLYIIKLQKEDNFLIVQQKK